MVSVAAVLLGASGAPSCGGAILGGGGTKIDGGRKASACSSSTYVTMRFTRAPAAVAWIQAVAMHGTIAIASFAFASVTYSDVVGEIAISCTVPVRSKAMICYDVNRTCWSAGQYDRYGGTVRFLRSSLPS